MKRLILISCLAISIQACTDSDPDTTAPIIEILSLTPADSPGLVCGEMEDHVITLSSSDTLDVTFRLSDDEELLQYKLDLHNNFDCHGHSNKVETTDWYVISIVDVAGADQTITRKLPVPVDVTSGMYHFHIHATDAAANNAETFYYSLNVVNVSDTEVPVLSASAPSSTSFSAQRGTTLNFAGTLTDNNPLGTGTNGRLELRYWAVSNQNIYTLHEEDIDNSVAGTYDFSFDVNVPTTIPDGTYVFELRAFDAVNNSSNTIQYTVEVS